MPDSVVSPDLERHGREQYARLRGRIVAMRREALDVTLVEGGVLEREDARTEASPLSYQVRWQLQLAAEHLVALDRLVDAHGLPDYAGYVLVRAAIESSAWAHWLLQPNVSSRRVLRGLRMAWWNQHDAAELSEAAGVADQKWDKERRSHLEQLRGKVKGLGQAKLNTPRLSHTDMLTDVGRRIQVKNPSPLVAWRLASSLAHGNSVVATIALQHRAVRAEEPHVHSSTSSWALVSALVRTALDTFDAALRLFERRASQY